MIGTLSLAPPVDASTIGSVADSDCFTGVGVHAAKDNTSIAPTKHMMNFFMINYSLLLVLLKAPEPGIQLGQSFNQSFYLISAQLTDDAIDHILMESGMMLVSSPSFF